MVASGGRRDVHTKCLSKLTLMSAPISPTSRDRLQFVLYVMKDMLTELDYRTVVLHY